MLPLANPLTNEDPLCRIEELNSLNNWWSALLLIGSNAAYIPLIVWLARKGYSLEAAEAGVAMFVSIFYHTCQTTRYCFRFDLVDWTFMDHVTATCLVVMVTILTVNSRSIGQFLERHNIELKTLIKFQRKRDEHRASKTQSNYILGTYFDKSKYDNYEEEIRRETMVSMPPQKYTPNNYYYNKLYKEQNTVYDAWSAAIIYLYVILVVIATVAHPFSMQSFLIVIAFGMGVILFKIVIIDEGCTEPVLERISVPDLVTGLVLLAIGILFFILDSWMYYQWFHTLWHIFGGVGLYFYCMGVTKNTPLHHSPFTNLQEKIAYVNRKNAKLKTRDSRI